MARSNSLNHSQPNKLQTAWQSVIRPMLLLSIGIHAIALGIPLPSKSTSEKAAPDQTVTVTQLPPQEQSTVPPGSPQPAQAAVSAPSLAKGVAVISEPSPASVPLAGRSASPLASTPAPSSQLQPIAPPTSPPTSSPTSPPTSPSPIAGALPSGFPQYPGAQPGSFGLPPSYESLSHKTSDAIDAVDTWFQQQLPGKGFDVVPVEQSAQQMVYRVAKGGVTEFLSLIPNPAGGTNILVIPDPLQAGSSEQAILPQGDSQFTTDLANILPTPTTNGWQAVRTPATVLAEPKAFFEDTATASTSAPALRSGGETAAYGESQTVDAVFADLRTRFQAAEIELILQGDYGGGRLYQIARNGASRFLSLVPTQDGNSTVIVVWSQSPL
ncbi:MAG: hypothetical protein HC772_11205 [Leptolyngbyaceae cyanobacterium CRU_2_3]|nr:hypothetical protein [Leptolyngbyaceae cyanobacterium CRU_2_3]